MIFSLNFGNEIECSGMFIDWSIEWEDESDCDKIVVTKEKMRTFH